MQVKIGIIDSGIGPALRARVDNARCFYWNGQQVESESDSADPLDRLGHGAALAEIIAQRQPEAKFSIARVFFDRLSCTPAQIAAALDWQIAQGVRLVNMSFGLRADREQLREACARALEAGVVLVAASPARGGPVYPASYPGVIRATGDARCAPGQVSHLNSVQADFGGHVRASVATIAGASVGCAYVTAALAEIVRQQPGLSPDDLVSRLAAQAQYRGPERRTA